MMPVMGRFSSTFAPLAKAKAACAASVTTRWTICAEPSTICTPDPMFAIGRSARWDYRSEARCVLWRRPRSSHVRCVRDHPDELSRRLIRFFGEHLSAGGTPERGPGELEERAVAE